MRHVTFLCPFCRELGRAVTLREDLDPTPIVTDLQGGCDHAAAFGERGQTLEEAWALIEAALNAAGGYDVRPIDRPASDGDHPCSCVDTVRLESASLTWPLRG